jgi:hypothetical protein
MVDDDCHIRIGGFNYLVLDGVEEATGAVGLGIGVRVQWTSPERLYMDDYRPMRAHDVFAFACMCYTVRPYPVWLRER